MWIRGALVGVGRGVILGVTTNDVFTRARFEVPPRTSFLAQRTILPTPILPTPIPPTPIPPNPIPSPLSSDLRHRP